MCLGELIPPGWKPRLYGRQDAFRYEHAGKSGVSSRNTFRNTSPADIDFVAADARRLSLKGKPKVSR